MPTTPTLAKEETITEPSSDTTAPPITITASHFLIPPDQEMTLNFQRALGMAKGKIISIDDKGKGIIEIDGYRYEFEDKRTQKHRSFFPLKIKTDRELQFTFWPTAEALTDQEPGDPPRLKISNLRKFLREPGAVEVIGQVSAIEEDYFKMCIVSKPEQKNYFVTLMGRYSDQLGDYIQAIAKLEEGEIRLISHNLLYRPE